MSSLLKAAERFVSRGHAVLVSRHNGLDDKCYLDAMSAFECESLKMRLYLSDDDFELTRDVFMSFAAEAPIEAVRARWPNETTLFSVLIEWARYMQEKIIAEDLGGLLYD